MTISNRSVRGKHELMLRLDVDLLQDYTHEFHKTKANFMAIRERENLMGSVRKDIE